MNLTESDIQADVLIHQLQQPRPCFRHARRNDAQVNLLCVDLRILRGAARDRFRRVHSPAYMIGSAPDCDLVLEDLQYSKIYAYIFRTPTQAVIQRVGSGPPILLEGKPVSKSTLNSGDVIRTGPFEFEVWISGSRQLQVPEPTRQPGDGPPLVLAPQAHADELFQEIRAVLEPQLRVYPRPEEWRGNRRRNRDVTPVKLPLRQHVSGS